MRVAREQVRQIRALTRQADALKRDLLARIGAHRPQLLRETGCGALTAALLIGRTAGAERYPTDARTGSGVYVCWKPPGSSSVSSNAVERNAS